MLEENSFFLRLLDILFLIFNAFGVIGLVYTNVPNKHFGLQNVCLNSYSFWFGQRERPHKAVAACSLTSVVRCFGELDGTFWLPFHPSLILNHEART